MRSFGHQLFQYEKGFFFRPFCRSEGCWVASCLTILSTALGKTFPDHTDIPCDCLSREVVSSVSGKYVYIAIYFLFCYTEMSYE